MHGCIPPINRENNLVAANSENNLSSVLSEGNYTSDQLNEISDRIISLVSTPNLTLSISNETADGNQTISGNLEEIKSGIQMASSKESKLNDIQTNALSQMIDNAIIVEQAQTDPLAPEPHITFELLSSNHTFTITC